MLSEDCAAYIIHSEDMSAFVKIMKDTAAGVPYSEAKFHIRTRSGQFHWCRIRATALYNSEQQAIKAVGVILDIDNEKQLIDMAQKDTLTGLYNKATINSLGEQRMQENEHGNMQAILILDVDYFKDVNDSYGHLAGDTILSAVAGTIRKNIRLTDLAGRIGGDKFLVYLPNVGSKASALKMAEKLLDSLSLLVPEIGAPPISCSIGVAVIAYGEMDYRSLYKCADVALYARKNSGRRGVTLYDASLDKITLGSASHTERRTAVDSDEPGDLLEERLSQYTFRMLYRAQDLENAINRLLEIIGRSYDVSRVYIFKSSLDGEYCSNTFEWCEEDTTPQIDNLQNISYIDELGNCLDIKM